MKQQSRVEKEIMEIRDDFDDAIRSTRLRSNLEGEANEHPSIYFQTESLSDPWEQGFALFRDDPFYGEWQEAIRENRLRDDAVNTVLPYELISS